MEITKREIIASVSILAIMLMIGFVISGIITDNHEDKIAKYNKALKIKDDTELFKYAMSTNTGYAFIEGDLKVLDPVTLPELKGEYLAILKIKEKYVQKTRTVTYTDSNGKTKTKTETYWEWDEVDRDYYQAKQVNFNGVDFSASMFELPSTTYQETHKESFYTRYKYYTSPTSYRGTAFSYLKDNTMRDKADFYQDMTIQDTLEYLRSNIGIVFFWVAYLVATGGVIYYFCIAENDWLNR